MTIWELQKQNVIQKTVKDNVTFVDFTMLNSDLIFIVSFILFGVCSSKLNKKTRKNDWGQIYFKST